MIDAEALRDALEESLEQGEMSEQFLCLAIELARTYLGSKKWSRVSDADKEVVVSRFLVKLCREWKRIDPERNFFSYLTTMVGNSARDLLRERIRYRKLLKDYWRYVYTNEGAAGKRTEMDNER